MIKDIISVLDCALWEQVDWCWVWIKNLVVHVFPIKMIVLVEVNFLKSLKLYRCRINVRQFWGKIFHLAWVLHMFKLWKVLYQLWFFLRTPDFLLVSTFGLNFNFTKLQCLTIYSFIASNRLSSSLNQIHIVFGNFEMLISLSIW